MGKPRGSIGETKLKILAILCHNEALEISSYGYGIWSTLNRRLNSYFGEDGLRNAYHQLDDLCDLGLVKRGTIQTMNGASDRRIYHLTEKGRRLHERFEKYLASLRTSR